jgi:predicted DNA-binding protein (UPF0251 family)
LQDPSTIPAQIILNVEEIEKIRQEVLREIGQIESDALKMHVSTMIC